MTWPDVAEQGEVHTDAREVLEVTQHFGDGASTGREEELVGVDERDPPNIGVGRETVIDRLVLATLAVPLLDRDDPAIDVWREHLLVLVRAPGVVQEEALDTHEQVELDPLAQVRRLVPVGQ